MSYPVSQALLFSVLSTKLGVLMKWLGFRILLLAAAVSLAIYIPFKYATQLHAIEGIYAFLFPFSSLVALTGIVLALRPDLAFNTPRVLSSAVGAISAMWIATGVVCIPSLMQTTLSTPMLGAFATFHMLGQHVFLSLGVIFLLLAPGFVYRIFGRPLPVAPESLKEPAGAKQR